MQHSGDTCESDASVGITGKGVFNLALDCGVVEGGDIEPGHGSKDVYGIVVLYAKVERSRDALLEGGQQAFGDGGQERREDDGDEKFWVDCALVDGRLYNVEEFSRVGEMDGRDDGSEEIEGEEGEEQRGAGGDGRDFGEHAGDVGECVCGVWPSEGRFLVGRVLVEVPETDAGVFYIHTKSYWYLSLYIQPSPRSLWPCFTAARYHIAALCLSFLHPLPFARQYPRSACASPSPSFAATV